MPIPVTLITDDGDGLLPDHLLRPLIASRREDVVDPEDGSVTPAWSTVEFTGRLARGAASQDTLDGRQAGIAAHRLLTNYTGLATGDRIIDMDEARDTIGFDDFPWEVDGPPIPVWNTNRIHHYEIPVRRVVG